MQVLEHVIEQCQRLEIPWDKSELEGKLRGKQRKRMRSKHKPNVAWVEGGTAAREGGNSRSGRRKTKSGLILTENRHWKKKKRPPEVEIGNGIEIRGEGCLGQHNQPSNDGLVHSQRSTTITGNRGASMIVRIMPPDPTYGQTMIDYARCIDDGYQNTMPCKRYCVPKLLQQKVTRPRVPKDTELTKIIDQL
ncbi:hypothetical protein BDN72DRAFT_860998 [Pluteus cervinus]|uniref:Uncharacterized protein n=1 Tax=Pluteus cervinus TaxID=181527 RepID=A0ACD3AGD7_9AGAR|nr:hypothetical protein BDN72DRAFT_860998 [Pluteus cervinus]